MRTCGAGIICAVGLFPPSVRAIDVPVLNSLPGAHAKIFLDFDGDFTPTWHGHTPGHTPPYSVDADTTTFTPFELSNIHNIWSRVSEKYSPFNINVTTVDPGNRNERETMHVVIGGDGRNGAADYWLGFRAGGVAWTGGFYGVNLSNTAFVFPGNLLNDNKRIGEATAHEAGHGFGLTHQSQYNAQGGLITEYNPGDALRAPVMGNSYNSNRGLWWHGPTITAGTLQDDLAMLSNGFNGFGYRPDDHANALGAAATPLALDGNAVSGSGVIGVSNDADYFSFATGAGDISFLLKVAQFGPMLDSTMTVYDAAGAFVGRAMGPALGESLVLNVAEGNYFLSVTGAGGYGDIGQYFLTGTILAIPEPAGLSTVILTTLLAARRRRRVGRH